MVYISKFLVAVSRSGNENSHCYACYSLLFISEATTFYLCCVIIFDLFSLMFMYTVFFVVVTYFIFIVALVLLHYFLMCTFAENTTDVLPNL